MELVDGSFRDAGCCRPIAALLCGTCAVLAQNPSSFVRACAGAHDDEGSATADFILARLCFVFRYAHANQGTGDGADAASNRGSQQGSAERAGGNERSNSGNGERADADQPAGEAAKHTASHEASAVWAWTSWTGRL